MNRRRKLLLFGAERSFLIPERFVLLVDSEESGVSGSDQFEITGAEVSTGTTFPVTFSPEAEPFDTTEVTVDVSDPTITFPSAGKYFVQIGGAFQQIAFNDGGDKNKLLQIVQWGDLTWSSFRDAFDGCSNNSKLPDGAMTGDYTAVETFFECFKDNNLTSLPSNLLDNVTSVKDFRTCFFRNNLTSIPAGLFDKTTEITEIAFCFRENNLSSIPAGLFDKTTEITDFRQCFRDNNITSLPEGLFNKNTLADDFGLCFAGNTLDTADLSRLYCELSVFNTNTNVPFHGGSGNYDPALNFVIDGQTVNTGDARNVLLGRGWTITDGGAI